MPRDVWQPKRHGHRRADHPVPDRVRALAHLASASRVARALRRSGVARRSSARSPRP